MRKNSSEGIDGRSGFMLLRKQLIIKKLTLVQQSDSLFFQG